MVDGKEAFWKLFYDAHNFELKKNLVIGLIALDDEKPLAKTAICGPLEEMLPEKNNAVKLDALRLYINEKESSYRQTATKFYLLSGTEYGVFKNQKDFASALIRTLPIWLPPEGGVPHPENYPTIIKEYLNITEQIFNGKSVEDAIKEVVGKE